MFLLQNEGAARNEDLMAASGPSFGRISSFESRRIRVAAALGD
jgi:hypothetical protein